LDEFARDGAPLGFDEDGFAMKDQSIAGRLSDAEGSCVLEEGMFDERSTVRRC
jgi:hypothetical protein